MNEQDSSSKVQIVKNVVLIEKDNGERYTVLRDDVSAIHFQPQVLGGANICEVCMVGGQVYRFSGQLASEINEAAGDIMSREEPTWGTQRDVSVGFHRANLYHDLTPEITWGGVGSSDE